MLSTRDQRMLMRADFKRHRYRHEARAHRPKRVHDLDRNPKERWRGVCSCGDLGSWGQYEDACDWVDAHAVAEGLRWVEDLGWMPTAPAKAKPRPKARRRAA